MTAPTSIRLKDVCSRYADYGANIPSDEYVAENEGIRFLRTTDIRDDGRLKPPSEGVFVALAKARSAGALCQDGDLLLSRSGTIGRSFRYLRAEHGPCAFAGYLVRFSPRPGVHSQFLFYWTKTTEFQAQIAQESIQTTIQNFNGQKYAGMYLPSVSPAAQAGIADFLDRKTAAIDALIAKKERLIDLLEEKRQALITQAVTKGLDPNVPMKDSGIEWLGEIPAHWKVKRLKHVLRRGLAYGVLKPLAYEHADGVPLLRIFNASDEGDVVEDELMLVSPSQSAEYRRTRLSTGDLVVSVVGTIGRSLIVPESMNGANLSRALARIQLGNSAQAEFMLLWLRSSLFEQQAEDVARGSAQKVLNLGQLAEFVVPLPPVEEQREVAAQLSGTLRSARAAREALQQSVARLAEYRQALITAAVTGQLDVSEAS